MKNDYIVVAYLGKGLIVKAAGLTFDAAHDLRSKLQATGLYTWVGVGAIGAYFSFV